MGGLLSSSSESFCIKPASSLKSEDRIFKSVNFSDNLKGDKDGMYQRYKEFSKKSTETTKVLWKGAIDTSREDMNENLESWKDELELQNPNDYRIFNELYDVATKNDYQYWPQDMKQDEPFEDKEQNKESRRKFLYINVSRTKFNTDANKFNIVICHLITDVVGVSLSALFGELCKEGVVYGDDDHNIYLKFEKYSEAAS